MRARARRRPRAPRGEVRGLRSGVERAVGVAHGEQLHVPRGRGEQHALGHDHPMEHRGRSSVEVVQRRGHLAHDARHLRRGKPTAVGELVARGASLDPLAHEHREVVARVAQREHLDEVRMAEASVEHRHRLEPPAQRVDVEGMEHQRRGRAGLTVLRVVGAVHEPHAVCVAQSPEHEAPGQERSWRCHLAHLRVRVDATSALRAHPKELQATRCAQRRACGTRRPP